MSVFRVNKTKDYVTMSKYHFKEKKMSLKAKGLLSEMLSLPDEWDYSVVGLSEINLESRNSINSILNELEEFGYLKRSRNYVNGKIANWTYDIYEKPLYLKNEDIENEDIENLDIENDTQLNNKELITKELSNKELSNKELKRGKKFIKPTIEQIQEYCVERRNGVNAEAFYDFYESKDWYVGKNKMKDWKACIRTWEQRKKEEKKKSTDFDRPSWLDMDL